MKKMSLIPVAFYTFIFNLKFKIIQGVSGIRLLQIAQDPQNSDRLSEHPMELRSGCWNIKRGLIKREHEIIELIKSQNLDLLFLVETDSTMIMEEKDYKIKAYHTVFPVRKKEDL